MNAEEKFTLIRTEIRTEYDFISNRMSWYVTSQSFLVTAFTISGGDRHHYMWFLRSLIPVLGLLLSLIFWGSILAASAAIEELRRAQARLLETTTLADSPLNMRAAWVHRWGMVPPLLIPVLFVLFWIVAWYWALQSG